MKSHLIMTTILFLIAAIFPLITLVDSGEKENGTTTTVTSSVKAEESTTSAKEKEPTETVSLMVSATGKITEMSAEDYVYGAVCAEMPASFHKEALKAQAVASYTYMKWLKENSDASADITDNSTVHQAFLTEKELKEKWGTSYSIYSEKVKEAVEDVLYEYLTYENETAMTVFHGLSPGKTASASDVWKSEVPYLKSVTAPGDKLSPDMTSIVTLTELEFIKAFGDTDEKDFDNIYKGININDDGFITEIKYKNTVLFPTDLRSAYGLKSPFFQAEKTKSGVILTVYGKGHGVGMSQYSADYMARQGSTYKEILAHFYQGTNLVSKEK